MPKLASLLALVCLFAPTLHADEPPGAFPASWAGRWADPVEVVKGGKTAMTFPMELHVQPIAGRDAWTWRIVYGEGERRQVRPYELLPVEGETGHFVLDEKNGVRIDAYLEGDRLRSRFAVSGSVLEATYARDGDTLRVTLTTFGAVASTTSGGTGSIPPVAAYPLVAVQRGPLSRGPAAAHSGAPELGGEPRVLEFLASKDPREQAWGGYLAGALRYPAAPPSALVAALVAALETAGRGEPAVAAAALDALLRLEARVDPARLAPWLDAYPAQVLVLLGQDAQAARAVLSSFLERRLDDATWMGVVGLLVSQRAPGVAEHLLRDLELSLEVRVLPSRNMAIGVGGGDGERPPKIREAPRAKPRPGWPPHVAYALTDVPATGDLVVAPVPRPVYARRAVFSPGAANTIRFRTESPPNRVRILGLAALTGTPPQHFRLEERDDLTVYWDGEEDYVARVQTRWLYVRLQYERVLEKLARDGLLAPEAAEALPLPLTIDASWFGFRDRELPAVSPPD